jgi:predicted nucleic acid-binding protein
VTGKVVDASAIAAMVFGEAEGAQIAAYLQGFECFAPTLLPFEIVNVCVKKIRHDPANESLLLAALERFTRFGIDLRDIDLQSVTKIATRHGISAYDASYLWLARELGTELVTLDQRLKRAAALP